MGIEALFEATFAREAMRISYYPVVSGETRTDLSGNIALREADREETLDLMSRLTNLRDSFITSHATERLIVDDAPVSFVKECRRLQIYDYPVIHNLGPTVEDTPIVLLDLAPPGADPLSHFVGGTEPNGYAYGQLVVASDMKAAQRRVVDSILTSAASYAWQDLKQKWGAPVKPKMQIFISYRKGQEAFAQALAERLGREGFVPWFDAWEIMAGDSLPGKISEGLRNSMAFIPIITADYEAGAWATQELESAIHRRIEDGSPIIPVLLEDCEKPELIRQLRHVDMTDHDSEKFESKVGEVIDGIFRLTKNPFR